MNSRRTFLGSVAGLAGTTALRSTATAANDRVRLAVIGPGDQGMSLAKHALQCPNTEVVAFADIYTRRLEEAKSLVPTAKTYLDYRYLLDDKNIDAVIIATPQHLHCEHFVASIGAGKHVYQEKTMAFTVEHAKKMRGAYQAARNLTVQIGHQDCSSGEMIDAIGMVKTGYVGKITEIHAHMYRNTPHGKPQWSRPVLPDMTSENIIWKSFLGEAAPHPFDATRYINWRFFWDYSGGNYYENMSHQVAFWYKVLNLQIPTAVTSTGGLFYWKDGRQVPDAMCTSMVHAEELLFDWTSGFCNNELGESEHVLGTDGTITTGGGGLRYIPQKVNRPEGAEMVGKTKNLMERHRAHLQNFLDCVRSGREPNCPVELGFRVSIACRMAVDSYRQGRTLKWDAVNERIV
jgi:predicted dehydrogenase